MNKTVIMSLRMSPSEMDARQEYVARKFLNTCKRNKRVSKSLLCFVCAVADLSSGMTPLTVLFQHWGIPQYTHFLFPELHFILNNIVNGGEVYLLGTKETARQQKENILGTVCTLLFVCGLEVPT
jgi:hypothetical protein